MSKHRMDIFSDGVFAIVITLLDLEFRPPDVQHFTFSALSSVAPNVFAFVLSFVIVGMYWIVHHNMAVFVKGVDRLLLWLNLVLLLTVVFLPFSTAVFGRHFITWAVVAKRMRVLERSPKPQQVVAQNCAPDRHSAKAKIRSPGPRRSRAPTRTVKFCFMAHRHYRE
jgi:hypothetical protein